MIVPSREFRMTRVKAADLRKKDKTEILLTLDTLRRELASLRVNQVSGGGAAKLAKMYDRILTLTCFFFVLVALRDRLPAIFPHLP